MYHSDGVVFSYFGTPEQAFLFQSFRVLSLGVGPDSGRLAGRTGCVCRHAVSHSRHVYCVTQQTCLRCHTADMFAVSHSRHVCCVAQQIYRSAVSHSRQACCLTHQTCLLCHRADKPAVSPRQQTCLLCHSRAVSRITQQTCLMRVTADSIKKLISIVSGIRGQPNAKGIQGWFEIGSVINGVIGKLQGPLSKSVYIHITCIYIYGCHLFIYIYTYIYIYMFIYLFKTRMMLLRTNVYLFIYGNLYVYRSAGLLRGHDVSERVFQLYNRPRIE